ncbi:MAG: 23S rRNA (uracil(1939)-C(5))-methyltransferase, partial [Gammaproteobacteria bacterium]|nr:23S rRNA (uracil(1939)-C(5))-methyltransferase [Gammaproteobacteria bacterium]
MRDVTAEGKGVIGSNDGKTVFVDGALTGESIIFKRRKRRRKFDEADLVEVLEPSAKRVLPRCPHFLNCGGCTWQHLDASDQINIKQDSLLQAFERIGGVTPKTVISPLTDESWGYRRRARFGAKFVDGKGRALVGFRERVKPFIADMNSCETVHPKLSAMLPGLQDLVASMDMARRMPQVEASVGEAAISLVFRVLDEPSLEDMQRLEAFGEAENITVLLQRKGPETIVDLKTGRPPKNLFFMIPDFDVRIEFGPVDFIQVNHEINLKMIQQA